MAKKKQAKKTQNYRMVILDDDTLKEVRSARFSVGGLVMIVAALVLGSSLLTYLFVAFTPMRYSVPGYADINNNKVYLDLHNKISDLEANLNAQRTYTEGLKGLLNPSGTEAIVDDTLGSNNSSSKLIIDDGIEKNQMPIKKMHFCTPLTGTISAAFNLKKKHYGIDITAPKDSPILSIRNGIVINTDWTAKTGHTISILHDNNMVSIFKHNERLLKKTGEYVKKAEAVAIIGNTGEQTTGPHMHFELWFNGRALDPQEYFEFEKL